MGEYNCASSCNCTSLLNINYEQHILGDCESLVTIGDIILLVLILIAAIAILVWICVCCVCCVCCIQIAQRKKKKETINLNSAERNKEDISLISTTKVTNEAYVTHDLENPLEAMYDSVTMETVISEKIPPAPPPPTVKGSSPPVPPAPPAPPPMATETMYAVVDKTKKKKKTGKSGEQSPKCPPTANYDAVNISDDNNNYDKLNHDYNKSAASTDSQTQPSKQGLMTEEGLGFYDVVAGKNMEATYDDVLLSGTKNVAAHNNQALYDMLLTEKNVAAQNNQADNYDVINI